MAFNPNEHMMNLKGKDYLQVMWRLVWFREEKPLWSIEPEIIEMDDTHAVFRAVVRDEAGAVKCIGHGSESKRDFGDYIEKAETKAVGRALAMLGYGTQFTATELDEGERIVDSPVDRKASAGVSFKRSDDRVGATPTTGSREAARAVGEAKLEQMNAQVAAGANGPATETQKQWIRDNASDGDYMNIMQKYGAELERLSMKAAVRVIEQVRQNNAATA